MMQRDEETCIKNCMECPYARENTAEEISGCYGSAGIPGRAEGWNPKKLFCKKTGGMPCLDGKCYDAYQMGTEDRRHSTKGRLNAWERNRKYRRHLQKIAAIGELQWENCKNSMYGGAIYVDEDTYGSIRKPYYRRYWRARRFKYWQDISNRKVRRYKGDIHNGGFYKKIFDYWWAVD